MTKSLTQLVAIVISSIAFAQSGQAASLRLTSNLTFTRDDTSYPVIQIPGKELVAGSCSLHGYIGDPKAEDSVTLPAGSLHTVWKKVESQYFYNSDGGERSYQTVLSASISGFKNSYLTAICTVPAEKGWVPFTWQPAAPVPSLKDLEAMFSNYIRLVE